MKQISLLAALLASSANAQLLADPATLQTEAALEASKAWAEDGPDVAARLYAGPGAALAAKKALNFAERRYMADWVMALTYADPAAAQRRFDDWSAQDPLKPDEWEERASRLVLQARILLRQGKLAEAEALVAAVGADRLRYLAEYRASLPKKQALRWDGWSDETIAEAALPEAAQARKLLSAASLLIATHKEGDAALARFASPYENPFSQNRSTLYLQSLARIPCSASGLTEKDWLIAEVAIRREGFKIYALPFAQSRDEVVQPALEAVLGWSFSYKAMGTMLHRQHILVRCARAAPPPADARPDYDYLRALLEPRDAASGDGYRFDPGREPLTRLVADKEWLRLLNIGWRSHSLLPGVHVTAQTLLLASLEAEPKPDAAAIAILRQWMLPQPPVGNAARAQAILPEHVAFVEAVRTSNVLPPRVMALMEFKLGELHEVAGDAAGARTIYQRIAARSPAILDPKSSEVVRAQLRLAALASQKAEGDAIIAGLGLSPDQCSIYQSRPALTRFPDPTGNYPSHALREEREGTVQFEFDLGADGKPTNFRVLASTPPFMFDRATIRSFERAGFAPATRGGEALPCEAAVQIFVWRMPD